jgi:hypothetical protein
VRKQISVFVMVRGRDYLARSALLPTAVVEMKQNMLNDGVVVALGKQRVHCSKPIPLAISTAINGMNARSASSRAM